MLACDDTANVMCCVCVLCLHSEFVGVQSNHGCSAAPLPSVAHVHCLRIPVLHITLFDADQFWLLQRKVDLAWVPSQSFVRLPAVLIAKIYYCTVCYNC